VTSQALRVAIVDPATWSVAYDMPLAEALARAGCDVTVHCAQSPHVGFPSTDTPGVCVRESFYRKKYTDLVPLPRRVMRALRHPADLSKLVRRLQREADIVHVQWMPGKRVDARAWSLLAKTMPVTFTAHNAQERTPNGITPQQLNGFTEVIVHSAGGAAAMHDAGVDRVWQTTIGAYDQYARMSDPATPPLAIDPNTPLVAFTGLIREYKGVDVLLAAWPSVRARVPDAQLLIAGRVVDGPLPAHALDGVTIVPRFVSEEELGWILRRADVCAMPYRKIDMSGIAASALACGTPIVASDVGGLGEYAGRGALLVPPEDPAALADALVRVLAEPGLQDRLASEAQAAVREHYDWDRIAERYVAHYAQLLSAQS
jgi:glycosyltransferase involved in cell wall biosynthesis